jgi:hypothetical protein
MENFEKVYESPQIDVVEIQVEKGFAASVEPLENWEWN